MATDREVISSQLQHLTCENLTLLKQTKKIAYYFFSLEFSENLLLVP